MTADAPAPTPHHVPDPAPPASRWPRAELFAISFVILFFELACIRWFGSTVIFLTFFTNIALIACVLGMSVGCLAAGRRRNYVHAVVPLAVGSAGLARWTLRAFLDKQWVVDVGNQ